MKHLVSKHGTASTAAEDLIGHETITIYAILAAFLPANLDFTSVEQDTTAAEPLVRRYMKLN